ncbi:hypothetical protein [Actinoplanes flavus]|uniref:Uncharacterized protein n=1 Tax=Actinoplanes flavus TaxID=2820290 RepID=A0ABS3ULZ0_9ACTN|nr:hypothetical protein [Actinoplanes flavus]MBO3739466.1 hypothetical protein [Actinoplanes flavus]
MVSTIEVELRKREATFRCNGKLEEKDLGAVTKGQTLAMHHSGDPGVQFAVELVVKSRA